MNSVKMQILDDLLSAMAELQGKGFKSGLDAEKQPPLEIEPIEGAEEPLSIEKVEEVEKPGFDDKVNEAIAETSNKSPIAEEVAAPESEEPNEDELEELAKKLSQLGG